MRSGVHPLFFSEVSCLLRNSNLASGAYAVGVSVGEVIALKHRFFRTNFESLVNVPLFG